LVKAKNEHANWNRALANDLKRIPLTPEWLERCGFKFLSNPGGGDKSWRRVDFPFELTDIDGSEGFSVYYFNGDDNVYITECDFLHQLQNLYFALTGEELSIKETV
jgi:hypothetical protein